MKNNTKKGQGLRELNAKEMSAVSGAWLGPAVMIGGAIWKFGSGIYDGWKGK